MDNDNTPTFLLADQGINMRKTAALFLAEMGYYQIHQARNGTEAWAIVKNLNANFILSGWDLPDMSGLSLLKIIRTDPVTANIPFVLVVGEITKSQVIEAGEAGVSAILTQPLSRAAFLSRIEALLKVKEDPRDIEFRKLYAQGVECMNQGQYGEALQAFERSLTIYESAEIYFNVGYIKTAQGRYEEAIIAFQRAVQIDKAHAMAYHKMADAYTRLGRKSEARDCFELAAEIYLDKYQDEQAETVLMEALKLHPGTLNVFNSLGILYRRQEKFQEAIRAYRKALKINPEDEHIHYNLARVYLSVNSNREAYKVLTKALKINPGFDEARQLLVSIDMGTGLG